MKVILLLESEQEAGEALGRGYTESHKVVTL